jgi:hypothetical protein
MLKKRSPVIPVLLTACLLLSGFARGQSAEAGDTLRKGRLAIVLTTEAAVAAATLVGLNELWYKDYPRSSFHFFNDNAEWLQMDKGGHVFNSYQIGRLGHATLRWTGLSDKKSAWVGGSLGSMYLLIIEVLDGFSNEWGFSGGDFAGDIAGSALFISQQLGWHEQRISLKLAYHPSKYAQYRPDLLGSNHIERLIKDYNGESFWLSASIGSFMKPEKKFPRWICVSVGYSAEGMLGGRTNPAVYNDKPLPSFERNRRFFLSADIDFTKIPTRSKALKIVFFALNTIKIPFPALEINSKGSLKGHYIYF